MADPVCPGGCILLDDRKGVEMDRDDSFWPEKLNRQQGISWPHGVIVSDGQDSQVNTLIADQAHVSKKPGIAGQVNLMLIKGGEQKNATDPTHSTIKKGRTVNGQVPP